MEASLWKDLPEALFFTVLTFLPLSSLLKFRSVCKQWNSSVCSEEFKKLRRQFHRPFDQEFIQLVQKSSRFRDLPMVVARVVGCDGGLILMTNSGSEELYVADPLAGSVERIQYAGLIPRPGSFEQYTAALTSDPGRKHYNVFMALCGSSPTTPLDTTSMSIYHYSSDTGAWQALGEAGLCTRARTRAWSPRRGLATLAGAACYKSQFLLWIHLARAVSLSSYKLPPHYTMVLCGESTQGLMQLPKIPFPSDQVSLLARHHRPSGWEYLFNDLAPFLCSGILSCTHTPPLLFNRGDSLFMTIANRDGCYIMRYEEQTCNWALWDRLINRPWGEYSFSTPQEHTEIDNDLDPMITFTLKLFCK